jgi:hypothetical protein
LEQIRGRVRTGDDEIGERLELGDFDSPGTDPFADHLTLALVKTAENHAFGFGKKGAHREEEGRLKNGVGGGGRAG